MTKIENKAQYDWAVNRVEELLPLVDDNTPKDDKNPARPFRRQAAEGDFGRSAAVPREHLRIVRDQPDIPLPEPGSIGRPQCGFGQCAATARCIGRSERPARRSVGTPQDQLPFGTLLLRKRLRRGRAKFQKEAKIPTPPLPHDVVQPRNMP